jgi:sporulation protein YlmC with PRC-barrel domain
MRAGVMPRREPPSIHPQGRSNNMSNLQPFTNSPVKASAMIGTDVVNAKGDNLGDVKEVVIDPRTGRVAYAVVSFGGFLGMGEKLFAVPFGSFRYDVSKNDYVLDISKERLEAAPGFDPDKWPTMADEKWNRDVYKYYDRTPYWE